MSVSGDKISEKCKSCGADAPLEAKFCPMCGCSDFTGNDAVFDQSGYDAGSDVPQPATESQMWQPAAPETPLKKKKTGLIIGIVAASLVVLVGIFLVVGKILQSSGSEVYYDSSVKTDYTKGTFDGSVYTNEWADIKFELPAGFVDADASTYATAESETTECGAYFTANDSMSIICIYYEKSPTVPVYDEETYLDASMKSFESVSGITYKIPDKYSSSTVGGHEYMKAEIEFNNGYGNFLNSIYVRKLDNYMICISAIGIDSESISALVNKIKNVK